MAEEQVPMIIFMVPAYNEEENIGKLCREISSHAEVCGWDYRIFIVDDGSSDGTVDVVRKLHEILPVEVISNPRNMGPGVAFDLGFRSLLGASNRDDIIVTMEADNTSDLSIFDKMMEQMRSGSDLVLASCYTETGGIEGTAFYRKILSRGANFLVKMIFRQKEINTFSSFYRCYRPEILSRAYQVYGDGFIEEEGFVCAVDIFLKLERLGIRITEVPMVLKCHMRAGRSKMKMLRTTLSYLRLFLREAFRKKDVR